MNNSYLTAICQPILLLLALSLPTAVSAANNNADRAQDAQQTTQEQREIAENRRKKYESLSKADKKKVRQARKKYKEMTPEERRKLKEKWKKAQNESR